MDMYGRTCMEMCSMELWDFIGFDEEFRVASIYPNAIHSLLGPYLFMLPRNVPVLPLVSSCGFLGAALIKDI